MRWVPLCRWYSSETALRDGVQVAKKAGFMSDDHQAVHVNFGSVLDTDGKVLKSREGEVIKLHDLLEEAIRRAEQTIDEKNPNLQGQERYDVARAVGIGAIKYADLSTERTKDYVFDWEKMLSFEGNTAPYLQYAHARICSIFRKWGGDRESLRENFGSLIEEESSPPTKEELTLARRLVEFPSILDDSASTFSPHKLCKHLHSIASSFASFYENCSILNEEDDVIVRRRLALCDITASGATTRLGSHGHHSSREDVNLGMFKICNLPPHPWSK